MYCALNFVDDTSLWINKNCSTYEVREGIGDLSEHELYKTNLYVLISYILNIIT